jgi:uncharacterized membrane protein
MRSFARYGLWLAVVLVWASCTRAQAVGYTFQRVDFAFTTNDQARGINSAGDIVGSFDDSQGTHGFLFNFSTHAFKEIDFAFSTKVQAFGINSAGDIVGSLDDSQGTHGFLSSHLGGTNTVDFPGAISTQAFGINDAGQIVGSFVDSFGTHGFLATPAAVPEPGSLALLAIGAVGLLGHRASRPRRRS